jgi:protein-arginine kinase activator protein McsA
MCQFDKLCYDGKCDVCGKETKTVTHASRMGCASFEYCKSCDEKELEPYFAMVSYISLAGKFPDEISDDYVKIVRTALKGLNITEKQFIDDINEAICNS